MTSRGRTAGIVGVVALLLAVGTGYAAFAFIGLAALVLVGAAYGWIARPMNYNATRSLTAFRVSQGDTVRADLRVTNRSRRASWSAIGQETVGSGFVEVRIPRLAAGASADLGYLIPTDRRGVQPVGPIRFVVRDPYGLCERSRSIPGATELLVRPRTHFVRLPNRGRIRALDAGEADRSIEGSLTFHTLREYVPGDDRRRIHWRTSARTGTLMVKEHIDMTRPEVLIAFDVHAEASPQFEELVEFAASVGTSSLRAGHPVRLITSAGAEEMFDGRDGESGLLDAFTVVQPAGDEGDAAWLAAAAARSTGSTAVVCSVAADTAAAAGQTMFVGRFGTVACVGISAKVQTTTVGGVQVLSAPCAIDLTNAWNARFFL